MKSWKVNIHIKGELTKCIGTTIIASTKNEARIIASKQYNCDINDITIV